MKKTKSYLISFLAIIILILFAFSSISFLNFNKNISCAQTAQSNENLYIDVYDRDGNTFATETETYFNSQKAYIFQWEDVEKLVLNIDASKNIPTKNYKDGVEIYNLTIEVQFLQGYYNKVAWTNFKTLLLYSETQTGEDSYKNFINSKPQLNIDNGISGTDLQSQLQVNISTWGIYKFRMVINGQDTNSDYFIIQPAQEIFNSPKIQYKTTSSQITLHNAYNFSLKNADEYKYIDPSKIIWYALGETENGNTYSLTFSDINSGKSDFVNCVSGIYEAYTRTGKTFYFDDNGVVGTWKIWCEYSYDGSSANIQKSNVQTIKTGQPFTSMTLIWIILGVGLLCVVITILICLFKIKREKVYPTITNTIDN